MEEDEVTLYMATGLCLQFQLATLKDTYKPVNLST